MSKFLAFISTCFLFLSFSALANSYLQLDKNSQHALSPNGEIIAISEGDRIKIIDSDNAKTIKSINTKMNSEISTIRWSPNNSMLAVGFKNGSIKIYDMATHKTLVSYTLDTKHTSSVTSIAFSLDSDYFIYGTMEGAIFGQFINDPEHTNNFLGSMPHPIYSVENFDDAILIVSRNIPHPIGFQPSDRLISEEYQGDRKKIGYGSDNKVIKEDKETLPISKNATKIIRIDPQTHQVQMGQLEIAVPQNFSNLLVSPSNEFTAFGYMAENKTLISSFREDGTTKTVEIPDSFGNFMTFSPDEKIIVTASVNDKSVTFFNAENGKLLLKMDNLPANIREVKLLSGGNLFIATENGVAQLWNLTKEKPFLVGKINLGQKLARDVKLKMTGSKFALKLHDGSSAIFDIMTFLPCDHRFDKI